MKKTETALQRRSFMLTLGLGSLAGAAALLAGKQVKAAEVVQAKAETPAKKGYHESEHIKRYYRSARI
ncbi:MAG TPA: formate dehydrogenase [Methylophilaceae bacterium]|nr:formate dehydrogenase [Methylophilaceae bacterium]